MSENAYTLFVGVDVSAASVSVAWQSAGSPPCAAFEVKQSPSGWKELASRLSKTGHAPQHTLVVVEATVPTGCSLPSTYTSVATASA